MAKHRLISLKAIFILTDYLMKTNHTKLLPTPKIQLRPGLIQINDLSFSTTLLLDALWNITDIGSCSPKEWLTHIQRKDCHQILSWPDATPSPSIQDLYWDQNISVDILTIESACQQAQSIDSEQLPFQLVVFPNYPNSG